jgi:predicted hotdog family 3-hydroxylacyl-ACP dehydratase
MMSEAWTPGQVLPHGEPMLLLSRLVSWRPGALVCEVDVSRASPFAEAGLGVPRWVGLEYMAQAVGALDGIRLREQGSDVPPGYLVGTRRLDHVDGYFRHGVTLRITVQEILQGENGLGVFSCGLHDGERSLSCQLTVYRRPAVGSKPGV